MRTSIICLSQSIDCLAYKLFLVHVAAYSLITCHSLKEYWLFVMFCDLHSLFVSCRYLMSPKMEFVKFFGKNNDVDGLVNGMIKEIILHKK